MSNKAKLSCRIVLRFYLILLNFLLSKTKESNSRRVVQVKPICQGGSPLIPRIEETAVRWQVCYDVRQDTRSARVEPDVQEWKQLCRTAFVAVYIVHGWWYISCLGHRTITSETIYSRLTRKVCAQISLYLSFI